MVGFHASKPGISTSSCDSAKHQIANWMQFPLNDPTLYAEFVEITQDLIKDFCLETTGYRIIINGGSYQDFRHLHFHLVAGEAH